MNLREKQKNKSKEDLLASAAELFKKNGIKATGIDEIVKKARLTAGAFYHHFKTKEDLLTQSLEKSYSESWKSLSQDPKTGRDFSVKEIFRRYVSTDHRDHPEKGCNIVALGSEMPRESSLSSKITEKYLEKTIQALCENGLTRSEATQQFAMAVGAMTLARACPKTQLSDEIIELVRKYW